MDNKISVTVTGSNRVELVNLLRAAADNLDGAPATVEGKIAPPAKKAMAAPAAVAVDEDDDDFVTEAAAANGFDDDAEAESEAVAEEEESFDEPPKKAAKGASSKTKPKKITLDDVNDACKAHAAAKGRPATLAVLQKKFKTQSVTALKPEQYEACISAMAVN